MEALHSAPWTRHFFCFGRQTQDFINYIEIKPLADHLFYEALKPISLQKEINFSFLYIRKLLCPLPHAGLLSELY